MNNNDLQRGGEAIGREAARKAAGRDRSDDTASDFDAGHAAGRQASDPDSATTDKDVVERVRREYQGLNEEQRAAYRDGYASGANRNR
jgi:hypothetical protein